MLEVDFLPHGKAHARTLVDDQLAAQVGFLLVTLDEEFLSAAIQFPVDMTNGFARVVEAMFGKLDRETMERTLVQTRDESLHNLTRQELKAAELGKSVPIY